MGTGPHSKFAGCDPFDRNLFNRTPLFHLIRINEKSVDLFRFPPDKSPVLIHHSLKTFFSDGIRGF
jgi:hypothetical protein